jgi:hypothetical protein
VSNFDQTASAKAVHVRMSGHTGGCSCRKQISSGNTLERRRFRPATPKPARTSRTCLGLPGLGRKLPYIVDPDGPVRAIAPCAEAEGAGLRPTRSLFAKRLLIAEVPYGRRASRRVMSEANSPGPRKRGKALRAERASSSAYNRIPESWHRLWHRVIRDRRAERRLGTFSNSLAPPRGDDGGAALITSNIAVDCAAILTVEARFSPATKNRPL